jgi:hypothetical protein
LKVGCCAAATARHRETGRKPATLNAAFRMSSA